MQEPELIHGLQQGEEHAYRQLVALHKNRVYNTVLGFLQNETDAEDLTQEVFIKLFQSIGQFKGEASLGTWLYRIALTHSLDFLRKKKSRKRGGLLQSLFGKKHDAEQLPDFHHPGVKAEQKETAAVLFKAIRQLHEQQQAAFLLQKTENLAQAEIAAVMEISVGAVESLLHRARTNLRRELGLYYQKHYQ